MGFNINHPKWEPPLGESAKSTIPPPMIGKIWVRFRHMFLKITWTPLRTPWPSYLYEYYKCFHGKDFNENELFLIIFTKIH